MTNKKKIVIIDVREVRGVSKKTGREYVALDVVFETQKGEWVKRVFLNFNELFILGIEQ